MIFYLYAYIIPARDWQKKSQVKRVDQTCDVFPELSKRPYKQAGGGIQSYAEGKSNPPPPI